MVARCTLVTHEPTLIVSNIRDVIAFPQNPESRGPHAGRTLGSGGAPAP